MYYLTYHLHHRYTVSLLYYYNCVRPLSAATLSAGHTCNITFREFSVNATTFIYNIHNQQRRCLLFAVIVYDLPTGTVSLCLAVDSAFMPVGSSTTPARQSGTRCQMHLEIQTVSIVLNSYWKQLAATSVTSALEVIYYFTLLLLHIRNNINQNCLKNWCTEKTDVLKQIGSAVCRPFPGDDGDDDDGDDCGGCNDADDRYSSNQRYNTDTRQFNAAAFIDQ